MEAQGCSATNWADVQVAQDFDAQYVRHTRFSGHNELGAFRREIELPGGLKIHSGIYNATLHNCEVGDDAHYIANYHIGCNTCIENVNAILVDGKTTFGNGVRVPVMNEGGGREIPIFNELSASLAYILTLYRHRPEMIHEVEHYMADGVTDYIVSRELEIDSPWYRLQQTVYFPDNGILYPYYLYVKESQ